MNALRLYVRYLGILLRGQLQYRASFLMQTLGHFLVTAFEFFAIWALFERFGTLRGWSFGHVAMLYGTVSISFVCSDALTRGFDICASLIKSGDFDRLLLRPRSTALQLFGYELTLRRIGRLLQGTIVLIIGFRTLGLGLRVWQIALLLWTVAGSACLFTGLLIVQATMSFWTTESLEIMHVLTYGGMETAQYPLEIYRRWFRRFFTLVVPLSCVSYFPLLAVMGIEDPLGTPFWFQALAPGAGIVFLILGFFFWRFGQRFYASTGS